MNHIFYEGCTYSILVMRLQSKGQLWPPESFLAPFFDLVRLSLCRSCPGGADAPTSSPDCTWSLLTTTLFKSHNIDFKLGEEVRNIAPNSPSLLTTTLFKSHNIDFKLGEQVRNIAPNSLVLTAPGPC